MSSLKERRSQKELQLKKRPKNEQGELQPSPQEAPNEHGKLQHRKQREEALANKILGLCIASCDGSVSSYFVLSFVAIGLFSLSDEGSQGGGTSSSDHQSSQFQQVQFPSIDDGNCFGMGCGTSGSKVYFLGGEKGENDESSHSCSGTESEESSVISESDTESDDTLLESSIISDTESGDAESSDSDTEGKESAADDYSSRVFMLNFANSEPCKASEAGEMLSGMVSPLVMTVEEKLYVVAGTPVSTLPEHPFEVYQENTWEKLPNPPFLKPDSMFFQDRQIRSYVVIGNKIHMSTSSFSFSFDTTNKEWTPCTLFEDRQPNCRRRFDIRYPTHFRWMKYPPNNNEDVQNCGLPFKFRGGAVMYGGDVMICLVPSKGLVVAYKLVGGNVKGKQVLQDLKIPPDATSSYLADFGEGYLCLLCVSNNDKAKQDCEISITPFEVSKVKYELGPQGKMEKFINCSTGKILIHSPPSTEQLPPGKIWSPIGCFVV